MYSVMEGLEQGVQYNTPSYLHAPTLTSTASILNLSSEFHSSSLTSNSGEQYDQSHEYKTEPSTPTCTQDTYNSYPTTFTPSPSSSGCESPSTPGNGYNYFPCNLHESAERDVVPFPAPTPPLSASHQSKDIQHILPEPIDRKSQCSFTPEQIDCICDNLQNRGDIEMLGRHCLLFYLPKTKNRFFLVNIYLKVSKICVK